MTISSSPDNCPPKVSIISIALKPEEFEPLLANLSTQTFCDFEFVGEVGGSIPSAWNRAVRRARGEILVFTETDARPADEHWLEELVTSLTNEKEIVKGLEITSLSWDFSNLAAHRQVFADHPLDPSFGFVADNEFLSGLKSQGYHLVTIDHAPIINLRKSFTRHYIRRAFMYGLYWSRLSHRYPDPVELEKVRHAGNLLRAGLLNLFGLVIGWVIYLPYRYIGRRNKKSK